MADEDQKMICQPCVGEAYLNALIEKEGRTATCSYCAGEDEPCITIQELADYMEGAFERHYFRTSDQPDMYESMMLRDKESTYDFERHGEPVLYAFQEAASIDEEPAQDVLDILEERHSDFDSTAMGEECEFDADSSYEWRTPEDHEFAFEWQAIERSLKSETRYFNQDAEIFLARLFANLDGQITSDNQPVIVTAGPETLHTSFFRARVFHKSGELDEAMMRPDLHMGPPPGSLARAGRMNANGIAMFYAASDKAVALAEVRPPVGSRALIGEFQLTRQVRLLDVSALQSLYVEGSIFDPGYVEQLSLAKFLARLSDRITMPVMPDDEPTEYLITQMIADYLARKPAPGIDGILFKSVQCPGEHRNVVLFHHASRVEPLDLPGGTELTCNQYSSTEDGPEPDYRVWEEIPPTEGQKEDAPADPFGPRGFFDLPRYDPDEDVREMTLRVLTDALTAHHVSGVTFTTDDFEVSRHRIEKRDWGFSKNVAVDLPPF